MNCPERKKEPAMTGYYCRKKFGLCPADDYVDRGEETPCEKYHWDCCQCLRELKLCKKTVKP